MTAKIYPQTNILNRANPVYRPASVLILLALLAGGLLGIGPAKARAPIATSYYVSPDGSDDNPGTLDSPFATVQKCADIAQAGDTCWLRAGTYRETVTLPRSGTSGAPITFAAYNGETAIINGAAPITSWTAHDTAGGRAIYKASMPWTLSVRTETPVIDDQIFVDGKMMPVARWPNITPDKVTRLKTSDKAQADTATDLSQYSVTYQDSDLASLPSGLFDGGKINFGPGYNIVQTTCDVTSQTPSQVSLTCTPDPGAWYTRTDLTSGEYTRPSNGDFYYLWGKMAALDAPGEWLWQSNTLYLWAPDSSNPDTHTVEARRRRYAFDLGTNTYITLDGLQLFAATVKYSDSNDHVILRNMDIRYPWHLDWLLPFLNVSALEVRGANNLISDSYLAYAPAAMIMLGGTNNNASNNVIMDATYTGTSAAIGGGMVNPGGAQKNIASHNTIGWSGRLGIYVNSGLDVLNNDLYQSHLQINDLGTIYSWGTDGKNALIAYNLVHDNYAIMDLRHIGGYGIYLDDDTYNFYVCRNITWNTTQAGIFTFGTNGTVIAPNPSGESNRYIYHNTVDGLLASNAKLDFQGKPQTLLGTHYKNNLSYYYTEYRSNVGMDSQANYVGDGLYVNRAERDYSLRSDSPVIDQGLSLGSPCQDPPQASLGAAPDQGAIEYGQPSFVSGAVLRTQDLAALEVTCTQTSDTLADCQVSNLPLGRKLPENFRLRIGTANASSELCTTQMDYDTGLGIGTCKDLPTGGQTGEQIISGSLGTSWEDLGTTELGSLEIFSITPNTGPSLGGQRVTIQGRLFDVAPTSYRRPITLNNSGDATRYNYPVPMIFDSAALISQGKMRSDCGDLRFYDNYGMLDYWLEKGCKTSTTHVWIKVTSIPQGTSTIDMRYGNPSLNSASDGISVFLFFDDFSQGLRRDYWTPGGGENITVDGSNSALRISGTSDADNESTRYGATLSTWKFELPDDFALDTVLTIVNGPPAFAAQSGTHILLYGDPAGPPPGKRLRYWDSQIGNWVELGQSTIISGTPQHVHISVGFSGPDTKRTLRWTENNNLSQPLATATFDNPGWGWFNYAPGSITSFDARYETVLIRPYALPEPTASLGTEQQTGARFTFDGLSCHSVSTSAPNLASCTTPAHAEGVVDVTVANPDGNSFTLKSAYTYEYAENHPLYLSLILKQQ